MKRTPSTLAACLLVLTFPGAAADVTIGPTAPGDLTATPGPGAGAISLAWTAAGSLTGVTAYTVYHVDADGARDAIGTTDGATTNFTETGLANGATITYVVTATDALGEGPASAAATATTFDVPDAPQNVTARPGAVGTLGEVVVGWSAPEPTGGPAIAGYRVYRDGALVGIVDASASSFADEGLDLASDHLYAVSAVNGVGEGAQSDVACSMASPWGAVPGLAACPM